MTLDSPESLLGRRLLLMRHAKSDWSIAGQSDHQRALNARGRGDAPRIAEWIRRENFMPDRVLSSTATRTRETIELMSKTWGVSNLNITFDETLYLASPESILNLIGSTAGTSSTVLVLGHNPGMSYLVSMLSRESIELPTAAIAVFDCELDDWSELGESTNVRLVRTIRPKAL